MNDRTGSAGPPRLALLDFLRFAAALAVLLYHFTARSSVAWPHAVTEVFPELHRWTKYGYLGVEVFFFISGFVILMTAWGRDLPGYVASRIARLFPAYWVAVLLTGTLLVALGGQLKDIGIREVLMNLTMVQAPFGVRDVDGVYWTLWVELRFYALIAVFMLVGITRARVIALAMVWPIVGALAGTTGSGFAAELLLADWAPFFSAGMLLHVVYREGWSVLLAGLCAFQVVLAMTTSGNASVEIVKYAAAVNPAIVSGAVAFGFLAVAAVTTTRLRTVSWRPLVWFGALTYPLYLVHEYWGWWAISKLHPMFPEYVVVTLAALFVLVLAWLIHRLVEVPFAPRLRRAVRDGLQGRSPRRHDGAADPMSPVNPVNPASPVAAHESPTAIPTRE